MYNHDIQQMVAEDIAKEKAHGSEYARIVENHSAYCDGLKPALYILSKKNYLKIVQFYQEEYRKQETIVINSSYDFNEILTTIISNSWQEMEVPRKMSL